MISRRSYGHPLSNPQLKEREYMISTNSRYSWGSRERLVHTSCRKQQYFNTVLLAWEWDFFNTHNFIFHIPVELVDLFGGQQVGLSLIQRL